MKNSRRMIGATTLTVSLGLAAMPAMAARANSGTCLQTGKQVRTELSQHKSSANYSDAKKMQRAGAQFCSNGLYRQGMLNYSAALKLLGVNKVAAASDH